MNKTNTEISIFWFRRDLRLEDNTGLNHALNQKYPVLPVFIFDDEILNELPKDDHRVTFIYNQLEKLNASLAKKDSSLLCFRGNVEEVWKKIIDNFNVQAVFTNRDYEPYALRRDSKVKELLQSHSIEFKTFKDHVIFEGREILKSDNTPYTVFTPYKRQWLAKFKMNFESLPFSPNFYNESFQFPSLSSIGFEHSSIKPRPAQLSGLDEYDNLRNFPASGVSSNLGLYLRFGTVSIRHIIKQMWKNETFISELIWREFFLQILYNFPNVVNENFKRKYDGIQWRNDKEEFKKWCEGQTGYPIVDAGMRELNQSGYMHNRVRMITASFLCKHLLIDWKWGEAYFAKKLFDFELASNNGNWQWSAGTGCDAAPYFRIFNPTAQVKKFDPDLKYIRKWVPEFDSLSYATPMVEHKFARERALKTYKEGINKFQG